MPVLEETGFSYLEETAARIRESQWQAQQDLAAGRTDAARVLCSGRPKRRPCWRSMTSPLTEVRQLIYDAGRLHALGRHPQVSLKLDRAGRLMQQIGEKDGPALAGEATVVLLLLKDLRLAIEERSPTVPEKFRTLGHKVNMMALKSDLVLSGAHLTDENGQ